MPEPIAVRDAATVMLVRDADPAGGGGVGGFLRRPNPNSDFVGGAYVSPGAAVDEADRHADLGRICEGLSDDAASNLLGIPSGGLAFWVAAVRECFEEAGVLLAVPDGSDDVISFADPEIAARFPVHRHAVDSGERRLLEI